MVSTQQQHATTKIADRRRRYEDYGKSQSRAIPKRRIYHDSTAVLQQQQLQQQPSVVVMLYVLIMLCMILSSTHAFIVVPNGGQANHWIGRHQSFQDLDILSAGQERTRVQRETTCDISSSTTTTRKISTELYSSLSGGSNNNNSNNKGNVRKKKSARFRQVAHQNQVKQTSNRKKAGSSITSSSSSSSSSTGVVQKDRMWKRSSRSIEDLEASLTKRYGTDLRKWTSYDDDDDDNDDNDKDGGGFFNIQNRKKSKAAVDDDDDDDDEYAMERNILRARPVLDPWEKEELKMKTASKSRKEATATSSSKNKVGGEGDTTTARKMDFTHLISDKPIGGKGTFNRDNDDLDDDDDDDDDDDVDDGFDDLQFEFDDDDDDDDNDYHPATVNGRRDVGGHGGEGFFFRRPSEVPRPSSGSVTSTGGATTRNRKKGMDDQTTNVEIDDTLETKNQVEKKKREGPKVKPVMDENGNPLFLTTKQAQRIFYEMTGTTTRKQQLHQDDDGDEEDEEDEGDPSFVAEIEENGDDEEEEEFKPVTTWQDLGITSPLLLNNLKSMNCPTPLAVQEKTCRAILRGSGYDKDESAPEEEDDDDDDDDTDADVATQDVVVGTYTGSGKTLSFLVPLIQKMLDQDEIAMMEDGGSSKKRKNPKMDFIQLIIVAPGRELASQIATVARELLAAGEESSSSPRHGVALTIGGTTMARNVDKIRRDKPSIVVGTPGRLAELIVGRPGGDNSGGSGGSSNALYGRIAKYVGNVQTIVLDEFDALLESRVHSEPTQALFEFLQKKRRNQVQSVLCSATAMDMLQQQEKGAVSKGTKLLKEYLRPNYIQVTADLDDILITPDDHQNAKAASSVSTTRVSRTVIHGVVHVPQRRLALETLRRILHTDPLPQQILVFVDNARKVDTVVEKLGQMGIVAAPLHGGAGSQKVDRAEVSKALREGYVGLVVATELAARGLDAPLLTHVINLDLPTDASHYAHRAGRCGRGGRPGVVINITTNPQERNVPKKFAQQLGVDMYTVEPKNGKLNIVVPDTNV